MYTAAITGHHNLNIKSIDIKSTMKRHMSWRISNTLLLWNKTQLNRKLKVWLNCFKMKSLNSCFLLLLIFHICLPAYFCSEQKTGNYMHILYVRFLRSFIFKYFAPQSRFAKMFLLSVLFEYIRNIRKLITHHPNYWI